MDAAPLIGRILGDDWLTAGLNDPEARQLIEWLVDRAEQTALAADGEAEAWGRLESLCRKARGIRRFVVLWCHDRDHPAACQLAATERFHWPLPAGSQCDASEIMHEILTWESNRVLATPPPGRQRLL